MKNKSFLILFIFLLIVFTFTTTVFCSSSITFEKEEEIIELPFIDNVDLSFGYVVSYYEGIYYLCYLEDSQSYFYHGSSSYDFFKPSSSMVEYLFKDGVWSYNCTYTSSSFTFPNSNDIVFSSVDIYTDSRKSDIFFHQAPLEITKTLVEETEKAQIAEQIKIMIVGFLKYLIVLVISVIAFYKGWKFLLTQLRKS